MKRLVADDLRGIWSAVLISWDENGNFDEDNYRINIERTIKSNVHGVYTTGSSGEFYALDYKEFCLMVDIQDEICGKSNMPLQIGCCTDSTRKTIKLLEYANSKPNVGGVQVAIPYWMELNDRELVQFFRDITTACPEMPLIHYNIPRSKRFLNGKDYKRILDVAPNLIGVKYTFADSNFGQLQNNIMETPNLSYSVGESLLASGMMIGARGCYSAVINTNPKVVLSLYDYASNGSWDKAVNVQKQVVEFVNGLVNLIQARGEGTMDPVIDKGMAVASGYYAGSQKIRPPYIGWSDETIICVRKWMEEKYPKFVYHGE